MGGKSNTPSLAAAPHVLAIDPLVKVTVNLCARSLVLHASNIVVFRFGLAAVAHIDISYFSLHFTIGIFFFLSLGALEKQFLLKKK